MYNNVVRTPYNAVVDVGYRGGVEDHDGTSGEPALAEHLRGAVGRFVRATRSRADSLPRSRAETLGELARHGVRSMPELAAARQVSHQSVSRMMAELERQGLVAREPNPADARGFLFAITSHGRAVLDAERRARRDVIEAAIADALTPAERRALAEVPGLLDRLAGAIASPGPAADATARPAAGG